MRRNRKGGVYNMVRVMGTTVMLVFFRTTSPERCEDVLHRLFSVARFRQTKSRIVSRWLLQAAFLPFAWYCVANGIFGLHAAVVAFLLLFPAHVKIGISKHPKLRLQYVRADVAGSGSTEWFAIPWLFIPVVVLATFAVVRPIGFLATMAGLLFFL